MKQSRTLLLGKIADLVGASLIGDPACPIHGLATLESAETGELSFLSNRQYRKYLATTQASAVIIDKGDLELCTVHALVSENPRLCLAKVAKLFEIPDTVPMGIHSTAIIGEACDIHPSASIGPHVVLGDRLKIAENVVIGAGCVIGDDCEIGKHSTLKPRLTLYANVRMGEHCLIHSGAVLGSDGFGFANEAGTWIKMPHLGGVLIGNWVEIGANTAVDRGFLKDTILGDNVIVDNLVQIAHNVSIGAHTAIAGCVAIAGSATIGKFCLIGGGSSIAGHIQIADKVHITATSGVNHSLLTPGAYSSGFPAKPAAQWRKNAARLQFLDEMARRLRVLEKKLYSTGLLTEDE